MVCLYGHIELRSLFVPRFTLLVESAGQLSPLMYYDVDAKHFHSVISKASLAVCADNFKLLHILFSRTSPIKLLLSPSLK